MILAHGEVNFVNEVNEDKHVVYKFVGCTLMAVSYDAQRRKRALMCSFSHFQFLTFFNRYMFKLLICILFFRKLYTSVLKYGFE